MRIGSPSNLTVHLIRQDVFHADRLDQMAGDVVRVSSVDTVNLSPRVTVVEPLDGHAPICPSACDHDDTGRFVDAVVPGGEEGLDRADNAAGADQTSHGGTPPDVGPGGMLDVFA